MIETVHVTTDGSVMWIFRGNGNGPTVHGEQKQRPYTTGSGTGTDVCWIFKFLFSFLFCNPVDVTCEFRVKVCDHEKCETLILSILKLFTITFFGKAFHVLFSTNVNVAPFPRDIFVYYGSLGTKTTADRKTNWHSWLGEKFVTWRVFTGSM